MIPVPRAGTKLGRVGGLKFSAKILLRIQNRTPCEINKILFTMHVVGYDSYPNGNTR